MSNDSDSSEVAHSDIECFEALPDDTVEAIGSTENAIRKIIRENKEIDMKDLNFTNVPPAIADRFSLRNTRQIYNHSTGQVILNLITGAHETASRRLGGAVQNEIYNMGLGKSIRPKEADEAYGHAQPVPGCDPKWPTVVVEVGVSESYRKLRAGADWWIMDSRDDVKLVIIVSVSRKIPDIKFETVILETDSLLQRRYELKIRQIIMVSCDANSLISIRPAVPLTIGFEELFCRQPVPPEYNIELLPDRLGQILEHVWGKQGF